LFVPLGPSHIAALAVAIAAGVTLAITVRLWPGWLAAVIRWGLASSLLVIWILWLLLVFKNGWASLATLLPMNLCDWNTAVVIVTLIWRKQWSYDLAYFWTFGGTIQALLTPDLAYDFPDLRFVVFFGLHGAVIASVLFLTFGLRMRVWPSSIIRVVVCSAAYFSSALATDVLFGVNFGYLMTKPMHRSLLDLFSPWPYYVVEMALLAFALVLVLYLPFLLFDRRLWRSKS
jgi:hypothetical integral membrane protein (TIGR02206 family)